MTNKKNIAVLMGGWSVEREVSLTSGKSVVEALEALGHMVNAIDVTRDLGQLIDHLTPRPDVVFNALHGAGGEDGVIQGVLETLKLPYTHSGVVASAIGMNKLLSRRIFEAEGLPVPVYKVVDWADIQKGHPMEMPYVIKPIAEGSSKGVYIIHAQKDFERALADWSYGPKAIVEKYIPGREFHVAVMGDKAIGVLEICVQDGFYDYEAKYTEGRATHITPAPLPPALYQKALDIGLQAHKALGCRGVSRVDLRYDDTLDRFYILELNTQPGLTPLSLVPEIAQYVGISFPELLQWMVDHAQYDDQQDKQ